MSETEDGMTLDEYRGRVLRDAETHGRVVKLTGPQSVSDPSPHAHGVPVEGCVWCDLDTATAVPAAKTESLSLGPLDLDALRAALTEARGYAAKVKKPMFPPASVVQLVDIALSLIRELEARPRTVGDLTARDLGRRMRIGDEFNGPLDPALFGAIWMFDLDTPVEFLDDEPTNDHQQPGERLPSHEQAAQVLEGDARAEDAQEGRP